MRKRGIKRMEKEQTRRVEEDLFPTFKQAAGKAPAIEDKLPTICALRRSGTDQRLPGKGDAFDKAIETFSVAYADQNDKDYEALKRAISSGKLEAVIEEPK